MTRLLINKWCVILLLIIISFVSLLLFAISISPLTPFEGYDSCVFKQMGEVILQGKTPYLDLFDHKGPILYLINALGSVISSNRWGLFTLALLNMTSTLFIWHKTAKLYTDNKHALMPMLVALIAYLGCMEEGNLTEDWCLFPNSYTLYLFARFHVKNKPITVIEYLAVGIMTGCVIFIRANNISVILCSAIYLTYLYIKKRQWSHLGKAYFFVITGICLVTIGIIGLFYILYGRSGVEQMFFGTFGFNFMYAGFHSYYDFLISSLYNHIYFLGAIMIVAFAYMNNSDIDGNIEFSLFLILSFILCFYLMGTASFRHYMINVTPLFLISSCYAFKNSFKPYIVILAFSLLTFESYFKHQLQFTLGQAKKEYAKLYDDANHVINEIKPTEKGQIWNYNAEMTGIGILQNNKLVQANRLVLNFQRNVAPFHFQSEIGKLESTPPKYILLDPKKKYLSEEDSIYINSHYDIIKELRMDVSLKNIEEHKRVNILRKKSPQNKI